MSIRNPSKIVLGLTLAILFLVPMVMAAGTVETPTHLGVSAGDRVVYSYQIVTTFKEPLGAPNNTAIDQNQFTVEVLGVNESDSPISFDYAITVNVVNSSTVTMTSPVSNASAFFNPYSNRTYLGNIGFFPFTFTDLAAGTKSGIEFRVPTRIPGTNESTNPGISRINCSVTRTSEAIDVKYTLYDVLDAPPIPTVLVYNSTTGVLQYARTWAQAIRVEKIFTYKLLSFQHTQSFNPAYIGYAIIVAFVAVVVYEVARRPSRRQRKTEKIRKKLEMPR